MNNLSSRKIIIPFLTVILVFSCFKKSQGIKQSDVPGLVNQFLSMHVQYHVFNDELSERTMHNYLNMLDYGKYYFYRDDINTFLKHKDLLDDDVAANKYDIIFDIFMVYKKRFAETMTLFDQLIEQPFDFNKDETMIIDSEKIDYAGTKEEMKERWRKNIKLQLLNYISTGQDMDYSKKKLRKRYELLKKRVDEITTEDLLAKFINAYSMALDPHSNFLTLDEHEDFKISMELKLEGIGVRLKSEDGFVIVESIIPGGATDKLPKEIKLVPSDKIVAVAQGDDEPVDVIDMDLRDVVKKIRGKKGTEVRLTVLRDTGESKRPERMIIPIVREEINLQDSDAESDIYTMENNGKRSRIGYINLPSFYQDLERGKTSAGDMKLHIDNLIKKNIEGLVLDLRGNPGGLLNEAIDIAGLFIDNGPIVQIKDGRNPPHVIYDNDNGIFYDGPVVILIDKFSASASEILAGAIKDYRRGLIIGSSNTFGKGTVQSYNPLSVGAIKVTTHIFYQPGGTSNQLNGIAPDILLPDMSAIWDIGEDKTTYALHWKKIQSAPFKRVDAVNDGIIKRLTLSSRGRIQNDKKYRELIEKINKFKAQIQNKEISLKEESGIEKQKKKELEKNMRKEQERKTIDIENDLFLKEAFNITNEYIKMTKK
ncbi:MAG: hypothetical protein CVV44_05690 [Spirochaetae bacterium HGW-Spirochaetae-1]|jgi:carboxyl-terminal processing protease|nr:MAG: hypothetical protein CVV44_05690 [Spirochaetae bacterium HGW-Spirochaetae-1]